MTRTDQRSRDSNPARSSVLNRPGIRTRGGPSGRRIAFVLVWLAIASPQVIAESPFDAWRWRAEITAPSAPFVAYELSPEILDACEQPSLADLRVADLQGVEIPFAVVRAIEKSVDRELVGRALNRDRPDADTSRLTLDFATRTVKNRITVRTAGTSFRRAVRVEGSTDQESWAELGEGWLHAVGAGRERFESLELGENSYRYLRVSVRRMPDEPEAPTIEEVTCRHRVLKRPEASTRELSLKSYEQDPATRRSTADFDLGQRHLPVVSLRLVLERDPQRVYRRTVRVLGRNSLEHVERIRFETDELGEERTMETPWSQVYTGEISRDASGEDSLELRAPMAYRHLRVVIENGDSPPLELGGAVATLYPVHIVFEPAAGTRFTLFAGQADASPPVYEARASLEALDAASLPQATLSRAPVEQMSARPPPDETSQAIVWALLALAVLATAGLLWYTAASVRQAKSSTAL